MKNSLLSTTQLSERLGVTRQAIYLWRQQGLPTAVNYSRTIRYEWEDVLEWLNRNKANREKKVG